MAPGRESDSHRRWGPTLLLLAAGGLLLGAGFTAVPHDPMNVSPEASHVPGYRGSQAVQTRFDIPYRGEASDDSFQVLDLYFPVRNEEGGLLPVFVFIHGGAFWMSDKRDPEYYPERIYRTLAGQGLVVIAPNYRLTPRVFYPAHAEDVAAALAWTIDHSSEYGGDPDRIWVSGHSAGGFLAAAVILDTRFLAALGHTPAGVRGVIPICGQFAVVDSGRQNTFGTDPQRWPGYSPLTHIRPDAPPFLVIEAARDDWWAPGQAEQFHEALRRSGVPSTFHELDDDHFTVIRDIGRAGDDLMPLLHRFIRP